MAELSLLVPELGRCLAFMHDRALPTRDLGFLGRADSVASAYAHLTESLFGLMGFPVAGNYPVAAVKRQAVHGDAGSHCWMELSPARFEADLTRLAVTAIPDPRLVDDLPQALLSDLADVLAVEGLELVQSPGLLLARGDRLAEITQTLPLEEAYGRNVADAFPIHAGGSRSIDFIRIFNEMQMVLHAHFHAPGEAFQSAFNGFLMHGAGALPASSKSPGVDAVISDHPAAKALATLVLKQPARPVPASPEEMIPGAGHSLMVLPIRHDLTPDQRVEALVTDWLQPLYQHLREGRLTRLNLLAERHGGWQIQTGQRWRFWRRPLSLTQAWKQLERIADVD